MTGPLEVAIATGVYEGLKWLAGQAAQSAFDASKEKFVEEPTKKLLSTILRGENIKAVEECIERAEQLLLQEYGADQSAKIVMDALRRGHAKTAEAHFWQSAAKAYISLDRSEPELANLARDYAQVVGIPAIITGEAPPPRVALTVLDRFFYHLRSVLLSRPELADLRQYEQLLKDSERNQLLSEILDQLTPTLPDYPAIYQAYADFILGEYKLLDFRGILRLQDILRLPLEEVYVPLSISLVPPWRLEIGAVTESVSFSDLLTSSSRIILLGHPGSGKTTLLRHLATSLIDGSANDRWGVTGQWFPIIFPVSAYADRLRRDPDLALLDYLPLYYTSRSVPYMEALLEPALVSGDCYVLLDGLDEVLDSKERIYVISQIEDFVRTYEKNRFVITSRIAGYQDVQLTGGFVHATLLPFDRADIKRFAIQWETALIKILDANTDEADRKIKARARAQDLANEILSSDRLTELATNPLLLTILALMHYEGQRLPERRTELYRACILALADNWNSVRSLSGRPIAVHMGEDRFDERYVVNMLSPVALWMHETQPGGLVHTDDLRLRLEGFFLEDGITRRRASVLANDFLRLAREATGILQEVGQHSYGFMHQTFEEYLAARAIIDLSHDPLEYVKKYADDPSWREVIRLAVGAATPRMAATLLLNGLLENDRLGARNPRNVILAGECLLDRGKGSISGKDNIQALDIMLQEMKRPTTQIPLRVTIGNLLGQLGDPRFRDPNAPIEMIDIPAGRFLMGSNESDIEALSLMQKVGYYVRHEIPLREVTIPAFRISKYPITNTQYQYFVDATGAEPPANWKGKDSLKGIANHPVVNVSWTNAREYCEWIARVTGVDYRLPTEEEWEKASRGTDGRYYSWGNEFDRNCANLWESGTEGTCPVGVFSEGVSPYGVEDMLGNVWEWCSSEYAVNTDKHDPKEFPSAPGPTRVLRGGAWDSNQHTARCAHRIHREPDSKDEYTGFRVAAGIKL